MRPQDILPSLFRRRQTLKKQFEAISADPTAREYVQVAAGLRAKAQSEWIRDVREHARVLATQELPALKQQRNTTLQAHRDALQAGVLGRQPKRTQAESLNQYADDDLRVLARGIDQMVGLLERSVQQTARSLAFQRWAIATTDELSARVSDAFDQAKSRPFNWDSWHEDRLAVRSVLAARAGNDQRAEMALRRVDEMENWLVEQSVPGDPTLLAALERELAEIRGIAESVQIHRGRRGARVG